ncbi:hypothetical protein EMPS_09417 [Entomortierella parvispora]|uniref:G domain-containing protein n=1 Tax=Entomortierella parvispora TaxID=205924 RepID=A0A9P3HII9_9FUNG|nr:hypothetical protein EMPS_09417 [Entomortierella parvispora]
MEIEASNITSVIFIGNPGVGKSALHNALGGSFESGYHEVTGMPVGDPQRVACRQHSLYLVDTPGVNDHPTAGCTATVKNSVDFNLGIIRDRLNNGGNCVVFFVIAPWRNGTIQSPDLMLMKLILEGMEEGPQIGLIMTQIYNSSFDIVTAPGFVRTTLMGVGANLEFLADERYLFLRKHKEKFDDNEIEDIRNYILGFEPRQVRIRAIPTQARSPSEGFDQMSVATGQQVLQDLSLLDAQDDVKDAGTTCRESVIFIGRPGVGKTTLHKALGATFHSGFRQLTRLECEQQYIHCGNNHLRLVDCPGILDNSDGQYFGSCEPLSMELNSRLNDGQPYAIFFVICPRNGRVDPGDLTMMHTVLSSMKRGPVVGLVLNQVGLRDISKARDPYSSRPMVDVLKQSGANIRVLSSRGPLVLADHEGGFFSDQDIVSIQDYVLSFLSVRKMVKVKKLLSKIFHLE